MARPLRILYENAYYHVMNRGADRQNIFIGEKDKSIFLQTLAEACCQFRLEVHAYCLMDNHYHLLLKTPEANLSRSMRHINGVYTQRYNKRHGKDGALFRGRYKAILVDSDAYLLHLSKYIHLNPITAKMVAALEQYEWSSYSAYIDKIKAPSWLIKDEVYGQLTQHQAKAIAYSQFMKGCEINRDVLEFYATPSQSPILGDQNFLSSLKLKQSSQEVSRKHQPVVRPSISTILKAVSQYAGVTPEALTKAKQGRHAFSLSRKMAIYIAKNYGDYQLQEIAEAFGLTHYGSASYAIHTFKQEINKNIVLLKDFENILEQLNA
ncbi:MAG: transposase [Legionella sp.]|nr:transposase [Legionella sp.]